MNREYHPCIHEEECPFYLSARQLINDPTAHPEIKREVAELLNSFCDTKYQEGCEQGKLVIFQTQKGGKLQKWTQ